MPRGRKKELFTWSRNGLSWLGRLALDGESERSRTNLCLLCASIAAFVSMLTATEIAMEIGVGSGEAARLARLMALSHGEARLH